MSMIPKNNLMSRMTIAFGVAIVAAIAPGLSSGVRAQIEFNNPDDPIPMDTVGGIANEAGFQLPENIGAPDESAGGGVRGDVEFQSPGDSTTSESVGGGVRGDDDFLSSTVEAGIRGDGEHLPTLDLTSPETTEVWEDVEFFTPNALAPENSSAPSTDESRE